MNFSFDTGFPPAATVNAGISRGDIANPFNPLAQFGVVDFDEISAYTTAGFASLTNGQAVQWWTATAPPWPGRSG